MKYEPNQYTLSCRVVFFLKKKIEIDAEMEWMCLKEKMR